MRHVDNMRNPIEKEFFVQSYVNATKIKQLEYQNFLSIYL